MTKENPIILLDVMVENLQELLADKGWSIQTVTETLGVAKENRDDSKILEYAKEKECLVITQDKKFIDRLKGNQINVFTIEDFDKANIINQKLEQFMKK